MERQAEGRIGEDQSEMRVGQAEEAHGHEERNDDHDRREHVGEEDQPRELLPRRKAKAREAVGGVTKISREGFSAVEAIQANGKAVKTSSAKAAHITAWPRGLSRP